MSLVVESRLQDIPVKRGKVRDVYDFGDRLLFVATDRISAFDYVLPTGIPSKGEVLTRISDFWFDQLDVPNHRITTDISILPLPDGTDVASLQGRSMVVKKADVVPIECVVRGYLAGSGWKEYCQNRTVCGIRLKEGLLESSRLSEPIFTPATKADSGHDENISFDRMVEEIGKNLAGQLRDLSLKVYSQGAAIARERGIIVADTKFEFGVLDGEILLIDEVLTPDSSRFWPQADYEPGRGQASYDKQYVRDWLLNSGWDRNSPPPELPPDVVKITKERYVDAYEKLTGQTF